MRSQLGAAAAVLLAASTVAVSATPAIAEDVPCTPSITMSKPVQDATGYVTFSPTSSDCGAPLRVKLKYRDRDWVPVRWAGQVFEHRAGTIRTDRLGTCDPDNLAHRWVAYATIKTLDGQLIAATPKVYLRTKPVTACGQWVPPSP